MGWLWARVCEWGRTPARVTQSIPTKGQQRESWKNGKVDRIVRAGSNSAQERGKERKQGHLQGGRELVMVGGEKQK